MKTYTYQFSLAPFSKGPLKISKEKGSWHSYAHYAVRDEGDYLGAMIMNEADAAFFAERDAILGIIWKHLREVFQPFSKDKNTLVFSKYHWNNSNAYGKGIMQTLIRIGAVTVKEKNNMTFHPKPTEAKIPDTHIGSHGETLPYHSHCRLPTDLENEMAALLNEALEEQDITNGFRLKTEILLRSGGWLKD